MTAKDLTASPSSFRASVSGTFPPTSYPADELLTLKVGAQVMFLKNDPSPEHAFYNGKLAVVTDIDDSRLARAAEIFGAVENALMEAVS